jgi:hypothetical protein
VVTVIVSTWGIAFEQHPTVRASHLAGIDSSESLQQTAATSQQFKSKARVYWFKTNSSTQQVDSQTIQHPSLVPAELKAIGLDLSTN